MSHFRQFLAAGALLVCLSQALFRQRLHVDDIADRHGHTDQSLSADAAVFVTPMLEAGQIKEAQAATKIEGVAGWDAASHADAHSGFITIDKATSSNTYFVLSKSQDGNADAPLLLWLQGGPGASSLFGLYTEIGPYNINSDMEAVPRSTTWNQNYHLLFLDNPLGTGFSFTEATTAFATNQTTVGSDLHAALIQVFQLFPDLRKNDFYVTGESYAGKYVPACAATIHARNKVATSAQEKINLKGISIGDGAMDPARQFIGFSDLLWYLGMVDEKERTQFVAYETDIQASLDAGDFRGAFHTFDVMLNADRITFPSYYANVTGMKTNYFNFAESPDGASLSKNFFIDWLDTPTARKAMHVGDRKYAVINGTVEEYLLDDWMQGVVPFLTTVLESGYKVLIYSGQNDIILGAPLTEQFLADLNWSGQQQYLAATKKVWTTLPRRGSKGGDLAGYARSVGNFTQIVVRGAGHMVPTDQPLRALDMLDRFIGGTPF